MYVLPYVPKGAAIKFFYKYFVLGFLTHIKYNYSIENWVWLCTVCWESLAGARTRASVVAACNLTSSIKLCTVLLNSQIIR